MLELDEFTREHLELDPRAQAQVILLARITTRLGPTTATRHACPFCRRPDALTITYPAGQAACLGCGKRTTLAALLEELGPAEETDRLMRSKPRAR